MGTNMKNRKSDSRRHRKTSEYKETKNSNYYTQWDLR